MTGQKESVMTGYLIFARHVLIVGCRRAIQDTCEKKQNDGVQKVVTNL